MCGAHPLKLKLPLESRGSLGDTAQALGYTDFLYVSEATKVRVYRTPRVSQESPVQGQGSHRAPGMNLTLALAERLHNDLMQGRRSRWLHPGGT